MTVEYQEAAYVWIRRMRPFLSSEDLDNIIPVAEEMASRLSHKLGASHLEAITWWYLDVSGKKLAPANP